jgi:peptide deformylase
MNLKMRFCGDIVLREKCAPVACPPHGEGAVAADTCVAGEWGGLLKILDEMAVLMDAEKGVGLAAPQVGILQRFFIMHNPDTKQLCKIINPKITEFSKETKIIEEGCLSVQDSSGPVFADVERPKSIVAEWIDETGAAHAERLTGVPARIFQHEYDHLDGKLFIDYLPPVKREMVMRKIRKRKL